MGTVYAIANQKAAWGRRRGGERRGLHLRAGYPTLLVDIDPQANATVGSGRQGLAAERLRRAGGDRHAVRDDRHNGHRRAEPDACPPDLAGRRWSSARSGSETRLRDALSSVRERFAYTLLDCPPSLGPLTVNALVAADRVIVPVQTEYFALEGLAGLLDTLALIQRELNPRLTVAGMRSRCTTGAPGSPGTWSARSASTSPRWSSTRSSRATSGSARRPSFGRPVIHHDPHCAGPTRTSSSRRRWRRVAERAWAVGLAALLAISEEAHADAELRHVRPS